MFETTVMTNKLTMSLAMILITISGVASAANQPSDRVEVRIWEQATVVTPEIRLEQVATISGPAKDMDTIKSFVLVSSLTNDQTVTLRAWEISQRLSDAGFDANLIDVRGSAKCIVTFVAEKDNSLQEGPTAATSATSKPSTIKHGPASLEAKVYEVIERNLASKGLPEGSKVEIKFNATIRELLALTEPPYHFEIDPQQRSTNWLGLVSLKIRIYRNDDLLQTVPVLAQVQVKAQIAIAARTINSKAKLSNQDVEMSWREITSLSEKFITEMENLADQQAKRMIPPGTIITADMLEPLPLVKRGQLVTVLYNRDGLEIKLIGKVMQNGYRDDTVQVRNERSKEVFRAKVIGAGQVLVDSNPMAGSFKDTGLAVGSKR
jgi:flagella basal body P-ring formation protein FlgA